MKHTLRIVRNAEGTEVTIVVRDKKSTLRLTMKNAQFADALVGGKDVPVIVKHLDKRIRYKDD